MAIGFTLLDGTTTICPDRGLKGTKTPKVLKATFGDGYEQRAPDGINFIKQSYNLSFVNRDPTEIDDIINFLDSKAGVFSFDFTVPDTNSAGNEKTIKVVCEDYGKTWTNTIANGCTATFRRVYEP